MDLADILRCPKEHEESWLVVRVHAIDDRQLIDGTLGCPVCGAEYPVRDGVADFRRDRTPLALGVAPSAANASAPGRVMRAAALLGLSDGLRVVVLTGAACALAAPLGVFATVRAIVVNPTTDMELEPHVSVFVTDERLPLAGASAHGAMLGADDDARARIAELVRVLKPKGRLVAAATCQVPADVRELARDDEEWVAERNAAPSHTVQLKLSR